MGGGVYNTGPPPLGFALDLLDFDPEAKAAFSKLFLGATSGDAEDYAKIILTAPGKPVVDVEISSINAYANYNLLIHGSKGTLKTTTGAMDLKYYIPEENTPRPVQYETQKWEDGVPTYCRDDLKMHEEHYDFSGTAFDAATHDFYEMLYNKLTKGTPMEVTPEMAARIVNVIETVHGQNTLPVMY